MRANSASACSSISSSAIGTAALAHQICGFQAEKLVSRYSKEEIAAGVLKYSRITQKAMITGKFSRSSQRLTRGDSRWRATSSETWPRRCSR